MAQLSDAFSFRNATNKSVLYGETRDKIISLVKEIDALYKAQMRRSCGHMCDLCGKGDTNEIYRVHDVVAGYENREEQSPCLCHNHNTGWSISYSALVVKRKQSLMGAGTSKLEARITCFEEPVLSDEEVDLFFAQYVAKQLQKESKKGKISEHI